MYSVYGNLMRTVAIKRRTDVFYKHDSIFYSNSPHLSFENNLFPYTNILALSIKMSITSATMHTRVRPFSRFYLSASRITNQVVR